MTGDTLSHAHLCGTRDLSLGFLAFLEVLSPLCRRPISPRILYLVGFFFFLRQVFYVLSAVTINTEQEPCRSGGPHSVMVWF